MPADRTEQVVEALRAAAKHAAENSPSFVLNDAMAKALEDAFLRDLFEALPNDARAVLRGEMVAVPVEPTQEMLKAASDAFLDAVASHKSGDSTVTPFRGWWAAMLAARPVKP